MFANPNTCRTRELSSSSGLFFVGIAEDFVDPVDSNGAHEPVRRLTTPTPGNVPKTAPRPLSQQLPIFNDLARGVSIGPKTTVKVTKTPTSFVYLRYGHCDLLANLDR
jgi:hypothetical protein